MNCTEAYALRQLRIAAELGEPVAARDVARIADTAEDLLREIGDPDVSALEDVAKAYKEARKDLSEALLDKEEAERQRNAESARVDALRDGMLDMLRDQCGLDVRAIETRVKELLSENESLRFRLNDTRERLRTMTHNRDEVVERCHKGRCK